MIKRILKTLLHMVYLMAFALLVTAVVNLLFDYVPILGFILFFGLLFWVSWDAVKSKERKDE